MTERLELRLALGLVAIALALRVGFALTLPVFQAPDERAHFDYVRFLLDEGQLPLQPGLTPTQALTGWPQSYQPPLAYLLFAPTAALTAATGAGPVVELRALRLQNALYGALLVAVVFGIARRLRPVGDPLRLLAPTCVALLPGLASNAASLNNDALANLLAATLWLVWLSPRSPGPGVVRQDDRAEGVRRGLRLGLIFGAACLAKLTAATLAPLLLLVPWLQRRGAAALREAAVASAVALVLLGPWLVRNALVYGDPLAVGVGSFSFERLAAELPPEFVREASTPAPGKALLQVFGRFGIANNLSWSPVPVLWLPLSLLGAAGWLRRRQPGARDASDGRSDIATAPWAACFGVAIALGVIGLASFSLRYYGAWQGRYLYVCMAPIALLLCEGGARWLPRRRTALAIALLGAALATLDAALLWKLDAFFDEAARTLWGLRTSL